MDIQGFFQLFREKAPGQNWEKVVDLPAKWGEIKEKEHNKGSKYILKIKLFLDCIMPTIPLSAQVILIWVIVSHK